MSEVSANIQHNLTSAESSDEEEINLSPRGNVEETETFP